MVNNRKIIRALLIISGLQFFIGIGVLIAAIVKLTDRVNDVIVVVAAMMIFSSVVSIFVLYTFYQKQNTNLEESMKNLEELNTKLRAQRHDYLNHLQVIYGLMELEEYEEAKKYMKPVFKDIMKVSKALKTKQPAVNALLQAKMEAAEKENIDFFMEIRSDLKNIAMEPWDLCKILGNLIDNGMTALLQKVEDRQLHVEIWEDKMSYFFCIYNNGPKIPKEHLEHIFKQGFTTKKEEGHGMGLAIISRILKENGGKIEVSSSEKKTSFEVEIKKMTFEV
ncbi:MAG: Spo0B domain-containing protein [Lachnospiraceae bacterium]|nr:Spo0B domain-containing protein [Lachnospiraceae bacterium]